MKKLLFLLSLLSFNALGANWSETSVTLLRGSDFASLFGSDTNRTELTFEHASGHNFGDNFFWFEVTDPQSGSDANNTELYGEWSPRFSMGKIGKFYNKDRFIQDVLLSFTLEHGRSGSISRARLYGLGFDLKLPKFAFFQYNIYVRDNPELKGTTFQSTLAYKMLPIKFAGLKLDYSAYIDIVHGDEGVDGTSGFAEAHWHTGQQFTIDLGHFWKKDNVLYTGVEYQYWNRKFGIKSGPVENSLKWMVKWVL